MSSVGYKCPEPFLVVRAEKLDLTPSLTAWCAGYELGEWRSQQLAKHLTRWLPEFALKYSEWKDIDAQTCAELLGKAAASIYKSEKFAQRGEFGEILLHAMVRQRFNSAPAISKYYFKDSSNDTVKGFDCVHVVGKPGQWELWLGEAKFYKDISEAISEAVKSLREHTERNYLRAEFTAITNKLDDSWGEAAKLRELLHPNTSLDEIFQTVCIPVLLTYDSKVINSYSNVCDEFCSAFQKEVLRYRDLFASKDLPKNVAVRLFLLPLKDKDALNTQMHEVLKACQTLY